MNDYLASLVANAQITRLALIGLAKNVGKTTTTNHLLETLVQAGLYQPHELALTSLGLDGEATDAMTGLPKLRYLPAAGMLVATAESLLLQAESEGILVERLRQLAGRTALGPIMLARIQRPAHLVIAGPTLLRDLDTTLEQCASLWSAPEFHRRGNQPCRSCGPCHQQRLHPLHRRKRCSDPCAGCEAHIRRSEPASRQSIALRGCL